MSPRDRSEVHLFRWVNRRSALAVTLALLAACTPAATTTPGSPAPGPSQSATASGPSGAGDRIRLVVDTDVAADDITAIASLVRDPQVELLAITVAGTGEAHCPGGMYVVRSVLTMLEAPTIPVACGRETPLDDAEPFPDAWRAGADSGNGLRLPQPAFLPDSRPAEQVLVDIAASEAAAGRRLTVLTLGTLTNLAGAAAADPAFVGRVRVVSMLGAVEAVGNVAPNGEANPTSEWNAHADPTAVRDVLAAGFDLTLVPLDATQDVPLTSAMYASLASDHAAGPADLVYELWTLNPWMTTGGYYLWDPLAAAVVRDPTIVRTRSATLRVLEGAGLDGGRLEEDPAGWSTTIAVGADRERFETFLLSAFRLGPPRSNSFSPIATIEVAIGPDTCEVVAPTPVPRGLVEVRLTSTAPGHVEAFTFDTNGIPWAELEAFIADPDFDHPPPALPLADPMLDTPGTASGYANVTAGPIGISCVSGDPPAPGIELRGPFEVSP